MAAMVAYAVLLAVVYKLFKIAGDLTEIKDLLRDIKRNTQDPMATGKAGSVPQSHDELLRALEPR